MNSWFADRGSLVWLEKPGRTESVFQRGNLGAIERPSLHSRYPCQKARFNLVVFEVPNFPLTLGATVR